ncbi:MAG: hypothetical protein AAF705_11965 [Bacteroidota bacterium]
MMRILAIIILLITSGCFHKSSELSRFESQLPKMDLHVLNDLVAAFDQLIDETYQGDIPAFLRDVGAEKPILSQEKKNAYCQLLERFESSTLALKSQTMPYDTVYASNWYILGGEASYSEAPMFYTITQEQDTSWGIPILRGERTIEEKIEYLKRDGYWKIISRSSFVNALKAIDTKDQNVIEYLKVKQEIGYINPIRIARQEVNQPQMDFDRPLIKRIIVFEVFKGIIQAEFGC